MTNLQKHLFRAHGEEQDLLKDHEARPESNSKLPLATVGSKKQAKISDAFAAPRPYAANDPKANQVTKLILEMLALDDLPFKFVNGNGFLRLMKFIEPCQMKSL